MLPFVPADWVMLLRRSCFQSLVPQAVRRTATRVAA